MSKRTIYLTGQSLVGFFAILALVWQQPVLAQSGELALGSSIPLSDLARQNATGSQGSLASALGSKGTVVAFWSNECPWVSKYHDRFLALAREYAGQGFNFVLVNSNDPVAFPKESLDGSRTYAQQAGINITYLMDPDGQLARAFGAARTPHVFVFNGNGNLAYVGTVDDSPGDPNNVQVQFLSDALVALVNGSDIAVPRTKAFGCTLKVQGTR